MDEYVEEGKTGIGGENGRREGEGIRYRRCAKLGRDYEKEDLNSSAEYIISYLGRP